MVISPLRCLLPLAWWISISALSESVAKHFHVSLQTGPLLRTMIEAIDDDASGAFFDNHRVINNDWNCRHDWTTWLRYSCKSERSTSRTKTNAGSELRPHRTVASRNSTMVRPADAATIACPPRRLKACSPPGFFCTHSLSASSWFSLSTWCDGLRHSSRQ
jgi:hypothetical protein